MPTYKFHNKNTGEVWEDFMGISASEEYLKENPHIEKMVAGAPGLVSGHGDRTKPNGGFKEVLSKIAEANPTSALANDYGKKDAKSVAVRNITQKYRPK
jgi:hypothetical protein